ncbi:MAG: gas vesicle protein GvpJ [Dehalococcoidales bacterium]|nr:gas vesicle protein GvpJ [Dehalococcoidales bacterium]
MGANQVVPTRELRYTLVDLLDRVLDKGLVIYADIIVSVAGIPLIGVNLRAALAGMETMLKYGMMKEWDESTRARERDHRKQREPFLGEGEETILRVLGSCHYHKGIYIAWRYGYLYLTNERLFLYSQDFNELLFETPLEKIKALGIKTERHFMVKDAKEGWDGLLAAKANTKREREVLYLLLEKDQWARLHVKDVPGLKATIEQTMKSLGFTLEAAPALPEFVDEKVPQFLTEGEKITHQGRAWYQVEVAGIIGDTWRPGHLFLTNKRLWWCDSEDKLYFEIPLGEIVAASTSVRDIGGMLKNKETLDIIYRNERNQGMATFSGDGLIEWKRVLGEIIAHQGDAAEEDTCPQCGRKAPTKELLETGCSRCGWVSPRLKKQLAQAAITK